MKKQLVAFDSFIFDKDQINFVEKRKDAEGYKIIVQLFNDGKTDIRLPMVYKTNFERDNAYIRLISDTSAVWKDDNVSYPLISWTINNCLAVNEMELTMKKLIKQIDLLMKESKKK